MTGETGPNTAEQKPTWTWIGTQCELILGGIDGRKISQQTWVPDDNPSVFEKFKTKFGLQLTLARIGQTEPTPDTIYELTFAGRNYKGRFTFNPYVAEPQLNLEGNQPVVMGDAKLEDVTYGLLVDYLSTAEAGEANV